MELNTSPMISLILYLIYVPHLIGLYGYGPKISFALCFEPPICNFKKYSGSAPEFWGRFWDNY